jgi:spore coat protein U-like protein
MGGSAGCRSRRERTITASLLLACAALLLVLHESAGGEATAWLGVTLTIVAGCTVSSAPAGNPPRSQSSGSVEHKVTVTVNCTNQVPYQLEIYHGGADAMEGVREPHITLMLGPIPTPSTLLSPIETDRSARTSSG